MAESERLAPERVPQRIPLKLEATHQITQAGNLWITVYAFSLPISLWPQKEFEMSNISGSLASSPFLVSQPNANPHVPLQTFPRSPTAGPVSSLPIPVPSAFISQTSLSPYRKTSSPSQHGVTGTTFIFTWNGVGARSGKRKIYKTTVLRTLTWDKKKRHPWNTGST